MTSKKMIGFCRGNASAAAQAFFLFFCPPLLASEQTALDRYVATPDSHYGYKLVRESRGEGYTAYVLDMTSQQWLTEKEVDKPIWKHWVTIIKPEEISSDTGLLFITGGSNEKPAPD